MVVERAATPTALLLNLCSYLRRGSYRDILSLIALIEHGLCRICRLHCLWCTRPLSVCLCRLRGRVKTNYPPWVAPAHACAYLPGSGRLLPLRYSTSRNHERSYPLRDYSSSHPGCVFSFKANRNCSLDR